MFCLYADTQVAENNSRQRSFHGEWAAPLGYLGPPAAFGLLSKRYEHQFGLDYSALGKLAVAQRNHALLNDNACEKLRKPITVDDYINSRMIADPIRLLDSVMVCDGGSGLLVTTRKRAKQKGLSKFVVPIGFGERTNFRAAENIVDVTESGHSVAGKRAFAMAGIGPRDVASFHPYDDFIIAIMLQLEMLGFCKHGQGCDFIKETDFAHTGNLPLNTGGGQISAGQAGLAGRRHQPHRSGAPAVRRRRKTAGQQYQERSCHRHRRHSLWPQLGHQRCHDPDARTREGAMSALSSDKC